jgi:hypothetical protein
VDKDNRPVSIDEIPTRLSEKDVNPLDFLNYARKDTIYKNSGLVFGNWAPSFAQACVEPFQHYIQEGAVISLSEVGRCDSGSIIVKCVSN